MTCILLNCIVKKLKNELAVRKLQNLALKWFNKHWLKFTGITPKKLHIPTSTMNVSIKKVIAPIKKVLIHLNILSLLIIFACGSDTVNNVVTPPVSNNDSLVLTVDSLTLYGTGFKSNDTILYNTFAIGDSTKISFTVESNCDSVDNPSCGFDFGTINLAITNNLNSNYNLYGRCTSNGGSILLIFNTTATRFIKVKNIKFYKVNPV